MKTLEWAVPLGVLTTAAVIYAFMKVDQQRKQNVYKDRHLIERGSHMPQIWLYYDNSEVNSRFWSDFGARSKRAMNMPFLNVCYDTMEINIGLRLLVVFPTWHFVLEDGIRCLHRFGIRWLP